MSINGLPTFNSDPYFIANAKCTLPPPESQTWSYQRGYALGVHRNCLGTAVINNHLHFRVEYNEVEKDKNVVVGFTTSPSSVRFAPDGNDCTSTFDYKDKGLLPITANDVRNGEKLYWTYSVEFVENANVRWASRWDAYFQTSIADSRPMEHWTHIIISIMATLVLLSIATVILLRTLHKDFNRYNSPDPDENQEEVGWKLVHADVFRPPASSKLLAALVGTGSQIVLMCISLLVFALLGFLSPASRGVLLSSMVLVFVLLSFAAGFICAKLLKMLDAREWKAIFVCALLFPSVVFAGYLVTDVLNALYHASDAASAGLLFSLFGIFLGINIPLTVLGASFAFHQNPIEHPVKVGKLAREIPLQKYAFRPHIMVLYVPIAPLCTAILELSYILDSLWQGAVYYVFGFLSIVFVLWFIAVILSSVVAVYYMLAYENYQWWWPSFYIPGALGLHIFIFFVHYYMSLNFTSFVATIIYFVYMGLVSLAYGLAAGSIGFLSCLLFTRKIFSSIKID